MIRLNTSWPRRSVPSQCSDVPPLIAGGAMALVRSWAFGSIGASHGAARAHSITMPRIANPMIPFASRRLRSQVIRLPEPNARVQAHVEDVHGQIDQREGKRDDHRDGLNDRKVPLLHGVDREAP